MKKLAVLILTMITAFALAACGDVPTQAPLSSAPAPSASATGTETPKIDIGVSLAGEDALRKQLAADIQSECDSLNLTAQISAAATAEQQQTDIQNMIKAKPSVIVIDPVDVDALEIVLANCELNGVHVISIVDSINGHYDMLAAPDYIKIGQSAGQCAAEALAGSGGGCMLLNTECDSLTMQLMSDGFKAAINGQSNITVAAEQFCGSDEELAYSAAKSGLEEKDISFIFAQSPVIARGAMRAIEGAGKDVKLVVYGGDMDIISAVSSGKAYACIFFSPGALAKQAVSNADSFIKSNTFVMPQFAELSIVTVKQADASGYYKEGAAYAETN